MINLRITRVRLILPLVFGVMAGMLIQSGSAAALSGSSFVPTRIIDDSTFFTATALNTGDIQNFLNAKVPTCDTNGTQPSGHSGYATRAAYGASVGVPAPYVCLKDYSQAIGDIAANAYCGGISGGTKSAADLIFNVSQACGVSAQSIIVLLQKEQALITDDWPWPIEYRSATGYGCPDTAACDSTYYGFFNQIYNAAKQLKRYVSQPQNYNYAAGRTSYVAYNPNSACSGTSLTIQNQATAALYNYTPYQPNQAALNNLYGSGDACSAYGNRNFWRLYNDWFGPTTGNGFTRVVSDDPNDHRQWIIYGTLKQHIPDSQTIYAWNLQNTPLVTMPADYLATISSGPDLARLMRLNVADQNTTVYFNDGGVRHRIPYPSIMTSWNLNNMIVTGAPRDLFNLESEGPDLTYAVKDPGNSAVYMLDGANSNGQTVVRKYASTALYNAWEGDTTNYTTLDPSSGYFPNLTQAVGADITSFKISYSGNTYEVVNGTRLLNPDAATASLYPGTAQPTSTATFQRLPDAGSATYLVRSANDPSLYLVDAGVRHHILWDNILKGWGGTKVPTTIVNNAFINSFTSGSDLYHYSADSGGQLYLMDGAKITIPSSLDAAYRNADPVLSISASLASLLPYSNRVATGTIMSGNNPAIYTIDNSGNLRHLEWSDKVTAWGGYQSGVNILSQYVVDDMRQAVSPQTYVSDGTNEYYLDNGKKWILPSAVKTAWGVTATVQVYTDGTLSRLPTGGTLTDAIKDTNGGYYSIREGAAHVTYDPNIAQAWNLSGGVSLSPRFIATNFPVYMLTRFVKSSVSGDNRTFVIDNGTWYSASPEQLANLGANNAPIMTLNPADAPTTITGWTYIVVKNSAGAYFVVDGGGKRAIVNKTIQDSWTNNGTLTVPTLSDGFLSLLPTNGTIERVVKGSAPAVYLARGAIKQHILYSDTYNRLYAPYAQVSDYLINALPTGSDL